jgi:hypothetical protein
LNNCQADAGFDCPAFSADLAAAGALKSHEQNRFSSHVVVIGIYALPARERECISETKYFIDP